MDVYKVETKRELIQFEIDGKLIEKTLRPLKNQEVIKIQRLGEEMTKLDQSDPNYFEKDNQIKEVIFKASFSPPFTDEELDNIDTFTLIEISERVMKISGVEKAMGFQQRVKGGQTSPSSQMTQKDFLTSLKNNPSQTLM